MRRLLPLPLLGGCFLWSTPPPPAEPEPPPEPTGPERCEDWRAPGRPKGTNRAWPTIAELRATLGERPDSPAVARLARLLGPGGYRATVSERWYAFMDAGVWLLLRPSHDGERVERVQLYGRRAPSPEGQRYGGPLPEGLSFTQTRADLEKSLGGGDDPAKCNYGLVDCDYTERGVSVDATGTSFDARCVSRVDLFRPMRPDQIALEDISVEPSVQSGAHGIMLRARPRFGIIDGDQRYPVTIALRQADGTPVREARWRLVEEWEDPLGARVERNVLEHTSDRISAFFPFVSFDLPEGAHDLVAELTVSQQKMAGVFGPAVGEPQQLTIVGPSTFAFQLDMPAITELRFGVREVALEPGEYDDLARNHAIVTGLTLGATALLVPPSRWALPDPMWIVSIAGVTAHRSSPRDDTLRGAWSGRTPWLRLAPGDQLTVDIIDQDGGGESGDHLQSISGDAVTLSAAAAKPNLGEGAVKTLRLTPVETR